VGNQNQQGDRAGMQGFWAIFICIMNKETKKKHTNKTATKWAKKILAAFRMLRDSDKHKFKNTFELGGDVTSKGEVPAQVADMLTIDDTFKVTEGALNGVTKMRSLNEEEIMQA
jgi:hypothetical protein